MGSFASIIYSHYVICSTIPWLADKDFLRKNLAETCLESRCAYAYSSLLRRQKSLTENVLLTALDIPSSTKSLSQQSCTNGSQLLPQYASYQTHVYSFGRVSPYLQNLCGYGGNLPLWSRTHIEICFCPSAHKNMHYDSLSTDTTCSSTGWDISKST